MIDREHELPISRQAQILGISRGSVYYLPRAVVASNLALIRRIDELHLNYPFARSQMLQGLLKGEGHSVGRLHVSTLMKQGALRRSTVGRTLPSLSPGTISSRICCAACRS
jgi:putative transposase